jgi:phosphate transport system permease protein
MTTALANTTPVEPVKPRKPWKTPTRTFLNFIALFGTAAGLATAITVATPLAGGLGWYVSFVLSLILVTMIGSFFYGVKKMQDKLATIVLAATAATVMIPWVSLISTVIRRGSKAFYSGFLTHDMLVNSSDDPLNVGGVSHAIVGTLILVVLASVIAVPLGVIAAVYIVEIKGRAAKAVRFFTQAMSGVPSIVAGLFVYSTVVVGLTHKYNAIAGALALAILMLPTVARTSEEVLKVVPRELRDASYALGASQFRTTFKVVLPTVRSGLVTAAVLGVARVAGETAPLLLTSQYFVKFSTDLYHNPIASLPTYIFGNLGVGTDNSVTRAWGGSLVLISIVVLLSVIARVIGGRTPRSR